MRDSGDPIEDDDDPRTAATLSLELRYLLAGVRRDGLMLLTGWLFPTCPLRIGEGGAPVPAFCSATGDSGMTLRRFMRIKSMFLKAAVDF